MQNLYKNINTLTENMLDEPNFDANFRGISQFFKN